MLGNQAGVSVGASQQLEATLRVEQLLQELIEAVRCGPINAQYEYGLPVETSLAHSPDAFPYTELFETQAAVSRNVAGVLGKRVTRGFIANVGETDAVVTFTKENKPGTNCQIILKPSVAQPFSWHWDVLEVRPRTVGESVSVQVLAQ